MPISLGELATRVGCELIGDPDRIVKGVAPLQSAGPDSLTFLSGRSFATKLTSTSAAAVVLRAEDAGNCPVAAFVSDDPYATYARMAVLIYPEPIAKPGVDDRVVVAPSASIAGSAHVAANVVVGERSRIGENVYIGPGTVIGADCSIDDDCRIIANVTLLHDVTIGARCVVHPGVVLGADGFGNANTADGWVKVPQVGGVRIGSDVEIGANTTIDRGTIGDTVIEDGVRIDNLCMIAHNVRIGEHSALAAMTGIAGSAVIGKRCMFAGKAGSVGHVRVCDDVIVSAKTFLTKDITEPGTYTASFPAENTRTWAKQLARFRRLGALIERVKKLEK